jgi:hypothetical protein
MQKQRGLAALFTGVLIVIVSASCSSQSQREGDDNANTQLPAVATPEFGSLKVDLLYKKILEMSRKRHRTENNYAYYIASIGIDDDPRSYSGTLDYLTGSSVDSFVIGSPGAEKNEADFAIVYEVRDSGGDRLTTHYFKWVDNHWTPIDSLLATRPAL